MPSILTHPMATIHSILSSFDFEDLRLPTSLDAPYWSLSMDCPPLHIFHMFPYCGSQAWALPPSLLSCLPRESHLAPLLDMFIGCKLSDISCTWEIRSLSQKLYYSLCHCMSILGVLYQVPPIWWFNVFSHSSRGHNTFTGPKIKASAKLCSLWRP